MNELFKVINDELIKIAPPVDAVHDEKEHELILHSAMINNAPPLHDEQVLKHEFAITVSHNEHIAPPSASRILQ